MNSLNETLQFFIKIAGELILLFIGVSFLIGLLEEYIPQEKIEKVLTGNRSAMVNNILGTTFGALTPFCSCSTIPITLGLLNGGAPFSSTMSFLIASPLLNPIIIGLLLKLLGLKITSIYFTIVFVAAVAIGIIWDKLGLASEVKNVAIRGREKIQDNVNLGHKQKIINAFGGAWQQFTGLAPWLLVGAGVGSIIYGFIPEELIVKIAGPGNPLAIPVAAVIGVPMYIRVATMLPISQVLVTKGMALGAVMALIIGGAGASIPEVTLLASIFKKKLVITFVLTVLIVATGAGFLFSFLI